MFTFVIVGQRRHGTTVFYGTPEEAEMEFSRLIRYAFEYENTDAIYYYGAEGQINNWRSDRK